MQRWLFVPFLLAFAFPARGQNAPAGDVAASYAVLSEVVVGGQVQGLVGSITGNINSLLGVTAEVFVGGGGMYAVLLRAESAEPSAEAPKAAGGVSRH